MGDPVRGHGDAHSKFCTCSRNCSICVRRSSPIKRELSVAGLGAERPGLAGEFLRQEIEAATDRAARVEKGRGRCAVQRQTVQFLANVGLRGHQDGFLEEAGLVERRHVRHQGRESLSQPPADGFGLAARCSVGILRQPGDRRESLAENHPKRFALLITHGD